MLYCKLSREYSATDYLLVLDPSKLDKRIRNAHALCEHLPGFLGAKFQPDAAWVVSLSEVLQALEDTNPEEFAKVEAADYFEWFESGLDIGEPVTADVILHTGHDGMFDLRAYVDDEDHWYESDWLKWDNL